MTGQYRLIFSASAKGSRAISSTPMSRDEAMWLFDNYVRTAPAKAPNYTPDGGERLAVVAEDAWRDIQATEARRAEG